MATIEEQYRAALRYEPKGASPLAWTERVESGVTVFLLDYGHADCAQSQALAKACGCKSGLIAIAFIGRQGKPCLASRYATTEARAKGVDSVIEGQAKREQAKADSTAKRKQPITGKPGDILSCSYGWDESHVDFYEIVEVSPTNWVTLRSLGKKVVQSAQAYDMVAPDMDSKGGTFKAHANTLESGGFAVKIGEHRYAFPYLGSPMYETAAGYGH